jgi:3-dehydroquinate synthetase
MLERGLPVRIDGDISLDGVLQAITRDKKRMGAEVPFVLVNAPGEVEYGRTLASEDVRAAVTELVQ